MAKKFVLFLLVILFAGACAPVATPPPEPEMPAELELLVDAIYQASSVDMTWEKMEEPVTVSAWNYPMQNVYEFKTTSVNTVSIRHLITGQEMKFVPYFSPSYSLVPLLISDQDENLAWSGMVLLQRRSDGMWIEKSLSLMTEKQIEATAKKLEELLEIWEATQNT